MFDSESRGFAGPTPPDLDTAPREPARGPTLTARQASPSIVRRDERQHQSWSPNWSIRWSIRWFLRRVWWWRPMRLPP